MHNKLTKVFDNVGFNFIVKNNNIIPVKTLNTYQGLDIQHVGYYIPYIARNRQNNLYETGVGYIKSDSDGNIIIERYQVIHSSNQNTFVNFGSDNNEFYIFANQSIFDKSSYNTVVLDTSAKVEPVSSLYLVDSSLEDIRIQLPSLSSVENLILEFKALSGAHPITIRTFDESVLCVLDATKNYIRLASTGKDWVVLNDSSLHLMNSMSEDSLVNIQSDPQGEENSLQYKQGSSFTGSDLYWDDDNNRLLFGSNSPSLAKNLISTSGNIATTFNNSRDGSDFIVYGSGLDKNLFFSYDGRVGINIPSGSRPNTVFQIVNTACQEVLRLENRSSCNPASVTLHHRPSTAINNNATVAQLKLASKNTNNQQINYASIEARAVNTSTGSERGALDITVASGYTTTLGSTTTTSFSGVKTIDTNIDFTSIGYDNNKIQINNNGNLLLNTTNTNGDIVLSNKNNQITISATETVCSSPVFRTNGIFNASGISATNIQTSNISVNTLAPSSLLIVDTNGRLSTTSIGVNGAGSLNISVPANKILSTSSNGAITGIYGIEDYFLTEEDIVWSKFNKKSASICLKQITFIDSVTVDEFAVGDQICITTSAGNFYRKVVSLEITNSIITGLVVDQNVTQNTVSPVNVYSVTRGGHLTISSKVDEGTVRDGSFTRISTRPLTDTVFNENQKDINFVVYGLSDDPAILVQANTGRSFIPSGSYNVFASNRKDIFPILVNANGDGISSTYSSANYNYDPSNNLFSGIVSTVGSNGMPSFYGTYDQNGNAAEWVEQPNTLESRDSTEFVAGGSYSTMVDSNIGASGLKSVEILTRASGYNYVGFRVASLFGLTDSSSITSNNLGLSFANVANAKNSSDDKTTTYLKQPEGSSPAYMPLSLPNLGSVNNNYRMSKYEITNKQYCLFLNSVAKSTSVDRKLYDPRMSSSAVGGIIRTDDGVNYVYSVKANMLDKPVVFVNYISAIRFINWLHNNAPTDVDESDVDSILDIGAYNIISIGINSFNIIRSSYRKYWLPDLNEWHKAAYYSPSSVSQGSGSSTVSINRDSPKVIADGIDRVTKQPTQAFANLSVSGWLYVDHLIVGDGLIMSSKASLGIEEQTEENTPGGGAQTTTSTSVNNLNAAWTNPNRVTVGPASVSCSNSECSFDAHPFRLDEDASSLCQDPIVPWWCDPNNNGPGWFIA